MRKLLIIIVDCSKFTEGFEPVKPTKSTAVYIQMIGRGMRPRRVKWWNRPLGEHYTVGDSLACAAIFLTLFALMLAVWVS